MTPAPFNTLSGDTMPHARAFWLRAEDGIRLRAGHWPARDPVGTVLLFTGRTEYLEKYDETARDLNSAGYDVLSVDWRGQGLSDRLLPDPHPCHIPNFRDFQRDVLELVVAGQELDLPRPWHLLAHSMGGAIGLAALEDGLPVVSAAFSSPMWGIHLHKVPVPIAKTICALAGLVGRGAQPAWMTGGNLSFILQETFQENALSNDGLRWGRLVAQTAHWPEIALGGATWTWVQQALAENQRLTRIPAPDIPALIALGLDDKIVSLPAIRERAQNWPGARLIELSGCRHEPLIERNAVRTPFLEAMVAHFDHYGASTA